MVGRALPLAAASPRVRPPANARPASLGGCAASTVQQPRPVRRPPSASPSSSPPLLRSTFPRPCLPACLRARRCRCACAAAPPVPGGAPAPGLVVLQGAPPSPTGRPSSESCHGPPEPRLSLSPTGASGDPSGVAAACLPACSGAGRQADSMGPDSGVGPPPGASPGASLAPLRHGALETRHTAPAPPHCSRGWEPAWLKLAPLTREAPSINPPFTLQELFHHRLGVNWTQKTQTIHAMGTPPPRAETHKLYPDPVARSDKWLPPALTSVACSTRLS